MSDRAAQRAEAVASAMEDIRRIEAAGPLDRDVLARFRARLLELLAQRALFPAEDFPPPERGAALLFHGGGGQGFEDGGAEFGVELRVCIRRRASLRTGNWRSVDHPPR